MIVLSPSYYALRVRVLFAVSFEGLPILHKASVSAQLHQLLHRSVQRLWRRPGPGASRGMCAAYLEQAPLRTTRP